MSENFFKKNEFDYRNMVKFRKLKCLKPLYYHCKLCNNLLLNPRGAFLTSKSETTQKMTNIFKQFEKISLKYRVYVWRSNRYSA